MLLPVSTSRPDICVKAPLPLMGGEKVVVPETSKATSPLSATPLVLPIEPAVLAAADLQGARVDRGRAGVVVAAGEGQQIGARLGQAAAAADGGTDAQIRRKAEDQQSPVGHLLVSIVPALIVPPLPNCKVPPPAIVVAPL